MTNKQGMMFCEFLINHHAPELEGVRVPSAGSLTSRKKMLRGMVVSAHGCMKSPNAVLLLRRLRALLRDFFAGRIPCNDLEWAARYHQMLEERNR